MQAQRHPDNLNEELPVEAALKVSLVRQRLITIRGFILMIYLGNPKLVETHLTNQKCLLRQLMQEGIITAAT